MNTITITKEEGFYPDEVAQINKEASKGCATLQYNGVDIGVAGVRIAFKRYQFKLAVDAIEFQRYDVEMPSWKAGMWYDIPEGTILCWGV
jgi:hypothetical protein